MSVSSSPLRGYFASSSAACLPPRLHAEHALLLGKELASLATQLLDRRSDELSELTELAEGDALAAVLQEIATKLVGPQQLADSAMPVWVSFAQRSREYVDLNDLSPLVERVVGRLVRRVPPGTRSFVELYVWEVQAAFEVFRQRFQIAQDIEAIVAEVFAGLAHAMRLLDEVAEHVDLAELECAFARFLADWTKHVGDMGVVVDLELIRLFVNELVIPYRLSPRIWSLLILRLDRAFSVRAENRLGHAFGDALEALLGATQRFDFLRDLRADAYPYLPSDAENWGDLLSLLIVLSLRPGSRLEARTARALSLPAVQEFLGARADIFENAVRLGATSLRTRWERNFLDLYYVASARLLAFARVAGELAALELDATCEPSSESLIIQARAAVLLGSDVPSRRSLFRVGLSQLLTLPNAEQLREFAQRLGAGDAELSAALKDLFELAQVSGHQAEDLAPESVALLAQLVAADDSSVACLLQCFAGMHRIFDEHEARAELRAHLARVVLEGWETRVGTELSALHAVLSYLRTNAHWHASQLTQLMTAFEPSLLKVAAAVKISRVAAALADQASTAVLQAHPDYAKRIGQTGCDATRRDNYFTILRLAQVLGGANPEPKESMIWWWLSTIGVYLRNRDQPVMQGNLRAILQALAPHLQVEEQLICSDILSAVYRKGLAINIPRDLSNGSALNFRPLTERGPLWRSAFAMRRIPAPHHPLLSAYLLERAASSAEAHAVLALWQQFAARWQALGDPLLIWSELTTECAQAIRALGASRLQTAWIAELQALRAAPDCAIHHLLLVQGLERMQLLAFGLSLAPRVHALASMMSNTAFALPETPPAQGAWFAHKGQRDLVLLLGTLADGCISNDSGLAALNAGRYLLECILPYVPFSAPSWACVWGVALAELLPALGTPEMAGAKHCLALFGALTQHAETLRAVGLVLFAPSLPVFSEDPAQEADWRAFAAGLLVATVAVDAELSGEALAQNLALATPLFNEQAVAFWLDAKAPLCALFAAQLSPSLRAALDKACAAIDRTLSAEQVFQGAPASSSLDLALALRTADPHAPALWRADRVTRVVREGLTTPLPGDLTITRASGWQCPEMLSIRRAIAHLSECAELEPSTSGSEQAFYLGLRRLAWFTAFLRDGIANTSVHWLASSLLSAEWSGLKLDTLVEFFEASIAILDERFSEDSTLLVRVREVLAAVWLPSAAASSARELPVRQASAAEQQAYTRLLLGQVEPDPKRATKSLRMVCESVWFQRLNGTLQAKATLALHVSRGGLRT